MPEVRDVRLGADGFLHADGPKMIIHPREVVYDTPDSDLARRDILRESELGRREYLARERDAYELGRADQRRRSGSSDGAMTAGRVLGGILLVLIVAAGLYVLVWVALGRPAEMHPACWSPWHERACALLKIEEEREKKIQREIERRLSGFPKPMINGLPAETRAFIEREVRERYR